MDRTVFGERLRELRQAAGLSQKAAADALGVPQPNYARWEKGKMLFPAIHVPQLAELFGVSVSAFFADPAPDVPASRRGRPRKAAEGDGDD